MIEAAEVRHARILVVAATAEAAVLERMLLDEGHDNVASTTNPLEAGALHRQKHYDLVLLDLHMPGIDGFQVVEALGVDQPEDSRPVVLVAAERQDRARAVAAGARDFVDRPFEPVEMRMRVRNALELRLLQRRLERQAGELEAVVRERTAELRESAARYRSLAELASDWYWEQDTNGNFTKVSGPVLEMLGLGADAPVTGWNEAERAQLRSAIAERRPFLDFVFTRVNPDGSEQKFQVSGEPMFGSACQLLGYRGIGLEITKRK